MLYQVCFVSLFSSLVHQSDSVILLQMKALCTGSCCVSQLREHQLKNIQELLQLQSICLGKERERERERNEERIEWKRTIIVIEEGASFLSCIIFLSSCQRHDLSMTSVFDGRTRQDWSVRPCTEKETLA